MILTYLDGPLAEVYSHYCLSFSISAIIKGKRVVKIGPKVQTLGPSLFYKKLKSFKFFQTMFLLARVLPLVRISVILDHFWGSKGLKISQKGPFHEC